MSVPKLAVPWVVYVVLLAALSVAERIATPEAAGADRFVDAAINWFGLLGLLGAAIWSVAVGWRLHEAGKSTGVVTRLLLGGFFGPLFASVATTAIAHDVDGGFWMILWPLFGLLFVSLAMGIGTIALAVIKGSHVG